VAASLHLARFFSSINHMGAISPHEQQAIEAFKARATHYLAERLLEMRLFGSRARGEGHEDSDIDLLILSLHFIKSGLFPARFARILSVVQKYREEADL
jgi:predicted nucleotidyltransferase